MHLFYTPDIDQHIYRLNERESGHCIRVLRLKYGDNINLIDGSGGFYTAKIIQDKAKACIVEVLEKEECFGKRNYSLHVAIAPTKSIDRFEWFLEKSTEIGIDEITPILCDRSERKVIRIDRLEKIITSSVKQSLTAYHPKLNILTKFTDFIQAKSDNQKFIAHCYDEDKTHLKHQLKPKGNYTIMIGPEGDFSENEIALACRGGFSPVSLGNSRYRTETAGIIACSTTAIINI